MLRARSKRGLVALAAAGWVLAHAPAAGALEKCKAKIDRRDGTILVSAKAVEVQNAAGAQADGSFSLLIY